MNFGNYNYRAPTDCAMYHTGLSGILKSYNFDGGDQVEDTQFTTCIRRERGMCSIAYYYNQGSTIDAFILDSTNAYALTVSLY